MSEKGGTQRSAEEWEKTYREAKPGDLPWDKGRPDPELVRLVDESRIYAGRSIDLGCGPAHDAIFLRSRGFNVTAVDIAPAAIELAKRNAEKAGTGGIEFRVGDILKIADPHGTYTFVNDRGCFHSLAPAERPVYVAMLRRILLPGRHLFLRTFSDKEPPGPGPYRFSEAEIRSCFVPLFAVIEFREGLSGGENGRHMNFFLMRKV